MFFVFFQWLCPLTLQESSHLQDWTNARADNLRRRYRAGLSVQIIRNASQINKPIITVELIEHYNYCIVQCIQQISVSIDVVTFMASDSCVM